MAEPAKSELEIRAAPAPGGRGRARAAIACFGGMQLRMGGIPPFEFLRYLSGAYSDCDLFFYVDVHQCWYQKGLAGLTSSVAETAAYLRAKLSDGAYEKVVFMGVSAGGYAAILFGSLCGVDHVVAYAPQTSIREPSSPEFGDLKSLANARTRYTLYGDASITAPADLHSIAHCDALAALPNVEVVRLPRICFQTTLKEMRDRGDIKQLLGRILREGEQ